jgi:hypothetical protein
LPSGSRRYSEVIGPMAPERGTGPSSISILWAARWACHSLEIEDRVFRAPYNYLKEKGIIDKVKELKARFIEIYDKDEHIPYGGNQMFFGDD